MTESTKKYTVDELLEMLVAAMEENPLSIRVDEEKEMAYIKHISEHEDAAEFWRKVAGRDVRLHFMASSDKERDTVRGAFGRTQYIRGLIQKVKRMEEIEIKKAARSE